MPLLAKFLLALLPTALTIAYIMGLRSRKTASIRSGSSCFLGQRPIVSAGTLSRDHRRSNWNGIPGVRHHHEPLSQDSYLADLIPWSATFTGHLKGAEAIYNGARGNLVGIKTFHIAR
jgi:hypothetical protein